MGNERLFSTIRIREPSTKEDERPRALKRVGRN